MTDSAACLEDMVGGVGCVVRLALSPSIGTLQSAPYLPVPTPENRFAPAPVLSREG